MRLSLALEGTGAGTRNTGIGFLDHMLDLLARHGRLDLEVSVSGDLQTGAHHTAEDTAIVLGQALDSALGNGEGAWAAAMRAAALLGETAQERAKLVDAVREPTADLVRRLLVAMLLHGNRHALLRELDATLLGNERVVAQLRAS